MSSFIKNISIRDKIFFVILLSFFVTVSVIIIQYNSIYNIEKYTKYLKVLTTLDKDLSTLQNDYSKLNVELIKIVSAQKTDEFLKSKNMFTNVKTSIDIDYKEFYKQDFTDITDDNIQELYMIEDSVNSYFNNYTEKIVLVSKKIVELKTLTLNPNKIAENYKILVADQLKLKNIESNYNVDFHSEEETVNKLLEIYKYTIDYQANFLNKFLKNQDVSFSNITNTLNTLIENKSNVLISLRKKAILYSIILFIFGLIVSIGLSIWLSKNISNSLFKLSELFDRIAKGEIIVDSGITSNDEIGYIVSSMDEFLKYLNESVKFSEEIVKGNFKYFYEPLNENDILGNSLIQLQEYFKQSKLEENKREIEDSKRRRESDAVSLFAEILRQNQNNIKNLGTKIISNIVKFFNANQGMFFIVSDKKDEEDENFIELIATYAWNREKYFQKKIKIGDGLIGSVAAEEFTVYMTDVPEDYIEIKSGTGGANPSSILLLPIKTGEDVLGVIEIASFNEFESYEIQIIEKIANDIASVLKSVKISQQTTELLGKFQTQAEEMTLQENELKDAINDLTKNLEKKNKIIDDSKKRLKEIDEQNRQIQYKDEQLKKDLIKLKEINNKIVSEETLNLSKIKELFSTLNLGLISINSKDEIVQVNDRINKFLDYAQNDLITLNISKILVQPVGYDNNGYFNFFIKKSKTIKEDQGWNIFLLRKNGNKSQVTLRVINVKNEDFVFLVISEKKVEDIDTINSQEFLNELYKNYFFTNMEKEMYISLLKENGIKIPPEKVDINNFLKWSSKYEMGISLIDNQHKKWFEYINKFLAALVNNDTANINDLLTGLLNYTEYHFGFEERYFEEFNYKAKEQHKVLHEDFKNEVKETAVDFLKGKNVSVYKMLMSIIDWVNKHVLVEDRAYSKLFKSHGLK